MVRCADGTLYTGYAVDLDQRIGAHNTGRGAKYTAGRRPVALVYSESFESRSDALKREHQLKQFTKLEKEGLIAHAAQSRPVLGLHARNTIVPSRRS